MSHRPHGVVPKTKQRLQQSTEGTPTARSIIRPRYQRAVPFPSEETQAKIERGRTPQGTQQSTALCQTPVPSVYSNPREHKRGKRLISLRRQIRGAPIVLGQRCPKAELWANH